MKFQNAKKLSETEIRAIFNGKIPGFYYAYLKDNIDNFEFIIKREMKSQWFLIDGTINTENLTIETGNYIIAENLTVNHLNLKEKAALYVCGHFEFKNEANLQVEINLSVKDKTFGKCKTCASLYYWNWAESCPECLNQLGFIETKCEHEMVHGRCKKCYWNGTKSDYIKDLKKQKDHLLQKLYTAFSEHKRPENFTNPKCCDECFEHNETMKSADLKTLNGAHLGHVGWSPLCFLTNDAWMYYMPRIIELILKNDAGDNDMDFHFKARETSEPFPLITNKQIDVLLEVFEFMEFLFKLDIYTMHMDGIVDYWKKRQAAYV